MLTKKLSVGAISVALFGCGGGNESDPKLTSNETPATSNSGSVLSGVVLDGYLHKANVCLDKNNNAVCDSGDGTTVQTDQSGQYTLPFEGNVENYKLLVEAIANVTIDMDNPNQAVTQDFTLETPSSQPSIISPMTSMVASLATSSGVTFDEAAESLASELSVSADVLKSDYAADTSQESREIHMLARGITRVLQSAQESSVNDGVSQEVARKGSIQRLANLDAAQLKLRTDQLSHGASNTEEALAQIGSDYYEHLKIKPEDLDGDNILTRPRAPRGGVVNDAADTFDWQFVQGFTEVNAYEFSLDRGQSWQAVTSKPINVGAPARSVGDVQVRIMAKPARSLASGMALLSTKAFTATLVPAAPTSLTLNDADNNFDWQHSADFQLIAHYEYTLDGGKNWHDVVSKPQNIADIAIPVGDLKLRIKADQNSGRPAGLVVKSETAMTVTPDAPVAPVLISANDDSDILAWENVSGFGNAADYEINLGSGWQDASANPYQIGNVNIPANTIQLRVKANPVDGRPGGKSLVVSSAFNKVLNKPVAPTLPVINDADNLLNWTNVDGYPNAEQYEYSLDSGISYRPVTSKPQAIPDEAFKVGQVCVRIKASDDDAVGENLCSDKVFTVTPSTPSAPTNGLVNDALNTFNWDWVDGFNSDSDYEYRVDGAAWTTVQSKPLQLADKVYAVGSLEVRVKYDPVTGRPASPALSNTKALTKQPEAPAAPTGVVVDDTADTLDWTFVTGFTSLADYEWSMNQGTDWAPVLEKPVVVGDVAKSIDQVQVRVRANGENGMPAGAQASNDTAFTELPKLPALTGGNIVVGSDQANTKYPNLISWNFLSTTIADKTVTFDKPEYYEFTVDQGASWKPVTSVPQFIGTQAYEKSNVGLRVKKSVFPGLEHPASEILWASSLEGKFVAIQYLPMVSMLQVPSYADYNGWVGSNVNCIAEYDTEGKGTPIFWSTSVSISTSAEVMSVISELNNCGISQWTLPTAEEVALLSKRNSDSLPSTVRGNMISDASSSIWANKSGVPVTYAKGIEKEPSMLLNYAYAKWETISSDRLLADSITQLASAEKLLSDQNTLTTESENFLSNWFTALKNQTKTSRILLTDASDQLETVNKAIMPSSSQLVQFESVLKDFKLQSNFLRYNTDTESISFLVNVKSLETKLSTIRENINALVVTKELLQAAKQIAKIHTLDSELVSEKDRLLAASLGSDIHSASLALSDLVAQMESEIQSLAILKQLLDTNLAALPDRFKTLGLLITPLTEEVAHASSLQDISALKVTIVDGLNRAHDAGYVVSQGEATVLGRFAKLDSLGRFLPASATYAQGWRCVLDVSSGDKKRTWTLLQDGQTGGVDHVSFNAEGADIKSLLGAGGYLEARNNSSLCGFSDWQVPSLPQLKGLATATMLDGKEATLDLTAFPHHPANQGQKISTYYYWSDAEYSADKQMAYTYSTETHTGKTERFSHSHHSEQDVTLARLVRETVQKVNWIYLANNGDIVQSREQASCAKNDSTGEVWQLFDTNDGGDRQVDYALYSERLNLQNSEKVCGLSNWRLPSVDELSSLMPLDETVFAHSIVKGSYGGTVSIYLNNLTTSNYYDYLDLKSGEQGRKERSSHEFFKNYLYRFISK
ncbi:DUF1566 domain-containing protein [Vibrio coralliilyticus]|uniref:DUF1566 domain-containing protein n=1 Tax=Vibrio coralliilyticus TaxID=190893 RepID=UPI0009BD6107|nr:DUF1566 domain-containing protein [Vibrio coralliilyticus]AXN34098.1 DUF1566 domain-containing protein [Vibrio coralliilyticus]